jgi:plasmid maintenance system antidote protein VapI
MTIREQLAELVRQAENKRTIAQATDIDPATLTRIANGEREISGDAVDRLAAHFKLELRQIRRRRNK